MTAPIEDPELELVARALAEDLGVGDLTSDATVDHDARARAVIRLKETGVVYGLRVAELAFRALDPAVGVRRHVAEGAWADPGPVLELTGRARALLAGERTALNFLQRLSGIATLTAHCVRAVQGTGVRILDTRKTTPGMRALEKAAVRAGGGVNHRAGLYDAILIKENHVALAGGVGQAVQRARAAAPELPVEVECRSPADVDAALAAGAPRLLLDNMGSGRLREIVEYVGGRATLEASGGVTVDNIGEIAATGVEFISVGALTHSAPALDLSLIMEPLP
ncbi:MAG: carboxylating nicotinate-nucleotide diphosphorylase [Actinomycetota bacterium]|nr:carboxylating nicotinate-nucleotide diphosphorylase [Actinomycetota bacterium]